MTIDVPLGIRRNLGLVGAHASLLAGAVGLLFLQHYAWLLRIAQQGYGPYQTATYLAELSTVVAVIDVLFLRWAWKASRKERIVSLLWPVLFFALATFILVANNA